MPNCKYTIKPTHTHSLTHTQDMFCSAIFQLRPVFIYQLIISILIIWPATTAMSDWQLKTSPTHSSLVCHNNAAQSSTVWLKSKENWNKSSEAKMSQHCPSLRTAIVWALIPRAQIQRRFIDRLCGSRYLHVGMGAYGDAFNLPQSRHGQWCALEQQTINLILTDWYKLKSHSWMLAPNEQQTWRIFHESEKLKERLGLNLQILREEWWWWWWWWWCEMVSQRDISLVRTCR